MYDDVMVYVFVTFYISATFDSHVVMYDSWTNLYLSRVFSMNCLTNDIFRFVRESNWIGSS